MLKIALVLGCLLSLAFAHPDMQRRRFARSSSSSGQDSDSDETTTSTTTTTTANPTATTAATLPQLNSQQLAALLQALQALMNSSG
ncbi:Hypothetical predicted protein [Xyrichtys novacula]|uniref:Uncharacterized protein n=1 Tax=Xyrichtys novacula TaxID=13765 RepID=A0AAV1ETZ6_XYRNO|nr:Hypothetical predicted protein [Xyrichtys novacula]